jgi:hypothetical protein
MRASVRLSWMAMGIGAVALILAGGAMDRAVAAEKSKDKPAAPKKADRSGTAHVASTKASGAGIVAKAQACFGDGPKIEKIKPDEGKAGDAITIVGKNFGAKGCLNTVSFGPGAEAKFIYVSETMVTAMVPASSKKGLRLLTLTNASGEDSKPFVVK